jgi:hypothetical protein
MTKTLEEEFERHLRTNLTEARLSVCRLQEELVAKGLMFGETPIPTSLKPHFVPSAQYAAWGAIAERVIGQLETLAHSVRRESAFLTRMRLSAAARELIDVDPGYARIAVVSRPDAVYADQRLSFLEINADSPAMMTFADCVQSIQRELFPLRDLCHGHRLTFPERTPALLETFRTTYREWGGSSDAPSIAIVDWSSERTHHEHLRTAERFTTLGCPARAIDPRQLRFEGGRLVADGWPIDLVYRRVLFGDFLSRAEELEPLLRAYREHRVCMINPLRSYLVGIKTLLALLWDESVQATFSPVERETITQYVPYTRLVDESLVPRLRAERTAWVIKKGESHGGQSVLIGSLVDADKWEAALGAILRSRELWIAQQLQSVPKYRLCDVIPETKELVWAEPYVNWNPFLFGGKHAGAIARASRSLLINICLGGGLLPTVSVG